MHGRLWVTLALAAFVAVPVSSAQVLEQVSDTLEDVRVPGNVDAEGILNDVNDQVSPGDSGQTAPPENPDRRDEPGFSEKVRVALGDDATAFGLAGLGLAALGLSGFAAVTRYISPKEALKNPQRAMLYGFVRATPGAHLKQLSEEFSMKTSSILWHIRKLESADLVKSERVNGYRVFYPVEGGIEIKRVSRALAALQNDNAARIFSYIQRHPGPTARRIGESLDIHGGTARWHLRKLRDHGLLDEMLSEDGSRFYSTPLGERALQAREGTAVDAPVAPHAIPNPE